MRIYLRTLSFLYLAGCLLHVADILNLRLKFSEMNSLWRVWIIYLAIFDLVAAVGLWRQKTCGIFFFWVIAISQIVAYTIFRDYFGDQRPLIIFHLVALAIYLCLKARSRPLSKTEVTL